jgi:hypothetical protein
MSEQPATREEIVIALRHVAEAMELVGVSMEYYGGLNEIARHGKEMVGAAQLAKDWATGIEDDNNEQ